MFYLLAFVLGGFARGVPKLLLFAAAYMALYSILLFTIEAQALRDGSTSVPYIFGHLLVDWAVGFAVAGFGYLCRVVVVGPRPPPDQARTDAVKRTFE